MVVAVLAAASWTFWTRTTPGAPSIVPLTTYQGFEIMPSLSPDGTQVAFAWSGERGGNWDIYVKPMDAVTPLRLTSDPLSDFSPAWSPSGREIAFVRMQPDGHGAIFVTPPIPGSERKVGDVRPISATAQFYPAPVWTPDGRWLVVADLGETSGENGLFLIGVESGTRRSLITSPTSAVQYGQALISPSGDNLAYVGCGGEAAAARCDLWVQPLGRDFAPQGTPRSLTNFRATTHGATWMPDGRSLLMSVTTSQGFFVDLWRIPISGGEPTRLDWPGRQATYPTMSKSGRLVISQRSGGADIWQFDLTSAAAPPAVHPISSTLSDLDPDFSPDGSKIAFSSARDGLEQEIWVARADGGGPMLLTRGAAGRNRGSPRWSHDGKRIVFDSSSADGVRRAYIVDAAGGTPRLVSEYHANYPSWSHDDKWIYFGSSHSGRVEVWRVPSDGGTPEQLTRDGGSVPRESADGRTLYYRRQMTLYARPLAGGPDQVIVEDSVTGGTYMPSGNELFYIARPDASSPRLFELRSTDVTTRKVRSISRFESDVALGMTVSPDSKTALLTIVKGGSDLVSVEHFQ